MENNEIMNNYEEVTEVTEVDDETALAVVEEQEPNSKVVFALGAGTAIVGGIIYKKLIKPIVTKIKNRKKKNEAIQDAEFIEVNEEPEATEGDDKK